MTTGMMARNSMSESLQKQIDSAVQKLAADAYEVALSHVRDNREAIDRITTLLVERETLSGDEFRQILAEYTTIPEVNLETLKVGTAAAVAGTEA